MLDFNYFKTQLAHDAVFEENLLVEVVMTNGHTHHVRSVVEVRDGYVVLEVFQRGGDHVVQRPQWQRDQRSGELHATSRAAVSYESIAAVVIGPSPDAQDRQVGFSGR